MKTLLLLRHAKSSWKHADLPDHDRPLKKRGKRDAPKVGRLIARERLIPDLILSSTAKRARMTVDLMTGACDYQGPIRYEEGLYHADPTGFLRILRRVEEDVERIMIVGHNPVLETLLEVLTDAYYRLPTAALAYLHLPIAEWRRVNELTKGELVRIWQPKEIDV